MKRALLASALLLSACTSPDGLNLGQREYLTNDARSALEQTAKINATALFVGLLFGGDNVSPGSDTEAYVSRVASRASALLEGCAGASVTGSGYHVDVVADCDLNGVHWKLDETLFLHAATLGMDVSFLPLQASIGGVELLFSDIRLGSGSLPQLVTSDSRSGWRVLEFEGTVEVDATLSAATLTGPGRWLELGAEETLLPVTFDAFTLSAATCAPQSGSLSIGPREVLISPEETVAITQQVLPSDAPQDATITFGTSVERVTAACPSEGF